MMYLYGIFSSAELAEAFADTVREACHEADVYADREVWTDIEPQLS